MKQFFNSFVFFVLFSQQIIASINGQNFGNAIEECGKWIEKYMANESIPGLVVGVSHKGEHVWTGTFGSCDVENDVKCNGQSVMRTGSVTKSLVSALVAKLIEQSLIDLDVDIHQYLSESDFPKKQWKGEDVNITVRQLLSMTAGIRDKDEHKDFRRIRAIHNVTETLVYFRDDPLVAKPGTEYHYSNWGFHLLGAVMEAVTHENFEALMNAMFSVMHLNATQLSRRETVIAHRSRQYSRAHSPDKKHWVLRSASLLTDLGRPLPWFPMGGIIAGVPDLLTFTDVMLKSYGTDDYLKSGTVKQMWTPGLGGYGWGFFITNYTAPTPPGHTYQYVHNGGSVAGSVDFIGMLPELHLSLSVVANMGGIRLDDVVDEVFGKFVKTIQSPKDLK